MTTVKDIYNCIDTFAPFSTAMDFDNVGILAGNENTEVKNVLLALDITPDVIKETCEKNAQLIISHHPIIFEPLKSLPSSSVPYLLARSNLTAICAHTNLDLSNPGVNTWLAEKLKLKNIELIPDIAMAVGTLTKPMECEEFTKHIKVSLNCGGLRFSGGREKIFKVAVSSGSGGFNVAEAFSLGADAFITGEIKHHEILFAAQNNIMAVDVGHYRSEDVAINPLKEILSANFKNVEFSVSKVFTDTIKYV